MNYCALIVAAGQGSRMNLGYNKVFYKFKDGETILAKTINVFKKDPRCKQIVVVTNGENFKRIKQSGNLVIVGGGSSRQESVMNGLKCVVEQYVYIHDGARPFINQECLDRINDTLHHTDACLLTVPCKDTIKIVEDGICKETLDRSKLVHAQTPQAFKTSLIWKAYKKAFADNIQGTDDATLVEKCLAYPVTSVMGSYENIKITTIDDIK